MAAKITISVTAEQAMGADWSYLFGVEKDVEWVAGPDGKRRPGNQIGTRYTVAMLHNSCSPLIVRTPEITPAISAEEVAAACLSGNLIRVEFQGFTAEAYQGKNGLGISATAEKCLRKTTATPAAKP